MTYLLIKYVHIISMVLLFGTGLGSAFYKWMADRSGSLEHISVMNKHVVWADWWFTTPTIILQPLTGFIMLYLSGLAWTTPWIMLSLGLYVLAGLCWIPVVWLQIQMRELSADAWLNNTALTDEYHRYANYWFYLGIPAFLAMLFIVLLMVLKSLLMNN